MAQSVSQQEGGITVFQNGEGHLLGLALQKTAGGNVVVMEISNGDSDKDKDTQIIVFADRDEWNKFVAIWNKAQTASAPKDPYKPGDIGNYTDPKGEFLNVLKNSDGRISFGLMHDIMSLHIFELDPSLFTAFDTKVSDISKSLGSAAPNQNPGATGAGELHFSYEYRDGAFLRRATGTVKDIRGLWNALAALQPPTGAHGAYGMIGDDNLLGKEPGYGLRQLGLVARRYVTFNTLRVEQPSGWEQIGAQSGTFTNVGQMNDTTLGWVFFDLRSKFEVDLKSRLP